MAKVSGSYRSISRGVSQQVPELRLDGQHTEQVNLLSDPVRGLTRRRGSQLQKETRIVTGAVTAGTSADAAGFLVRPFSAGPKDYSLIYRKSPQVAGSQAPSLLVYNATDKTFLNNQSSGSDNDWVPMLTQGIAAVTQVGRYLIMATNNRVLTGTTTDVFGSLGNRQTASVWIRGGAYSRKYRVTFVREGRGAITVEYTTPPASYPFVLDTSDIPSAAADYSKQVNDRVNAYNSAVTQWLGTANAAIQPQAIAVQLSALLGTAMSADDVAIGSGTSSVGVIDSHIIMFSGNTAAFRSVGVEDSGDGTLARAAFDVIKTAEDVTGVHFVGKVLKVQAKDNAPAYYLKAVPEIPGSNGWGKVRWVEAAGSAFTPGVWFLYGTVEGGAFYLASTPALLRSLVPSLELPNIDDRLVGDSETNKAPFFVGRTIDYLGYFQDRLVVGSGGVVQASEVGNYFNFFRTSVLTVLDKDPVELYALGGESDTIKHSVIFDKNLLLFGDKQQYTISGRVPLTPATSSVVQSSAHEGATDARPVASGDLVFYGKDREGYTQIHQIQLGSNDDTSNSSDVTQQLSAYIPGTPREIVASTSPDMLFVRTSVTPRALYVFRYLDGAGGQQRLLDSWSRFEYSAACGTLLGISTVRGKLLLHWMRVGLDGVGVQGMWLVVDEQSLAADTDSSPYLDSMRTYTALSASTNSTFSTDLSGVCTAFNNRSAAYLQGTTTLGGVVDLLSEFPTASINDLHSGVPFDSYVTLTNPVIRDKNDVGIVGGRLTITSLSVSYTQTGWIQARVITDYSDNQALNFNGRLLGSANNVVGVHPISKGAAPVMIGREAREYSVAISSKQWYPLTMTGIEWTGQFFYNPRRV